MRQVSHHNHQNCSKTLISLAILMPRTYMKVLLRLVMYDPKLQSKGQHSVSQQRMTSVATIFHWGSIQLINQLNISRNLRNSQHKTSQKLILKIYANITMTLATVIATIQRCMISYTTNNTILNCWDRLSQKTNYKNRYKISVKPIL